MNITPALLVFLLIFIRCLGLIGTAPIISNGQIPAVFKLGIAFFLALIVDSVMPAEQLQAAVRGITFVQFIPMAVIESITGIAMGMIASMVFAAVQFAGEILDVQVGFSVVNIVSPGIIGPTSLISTLYFILYALWFLSVNGHYGIILALLDSFRIIPLGAAHIGGSVAFVFLQSVSTLFVLGIQIAAPVLLALFLTNVSLAVASRAVPQMNVFVVGLPVTLFIGLALIGLTLPEFVSVMQNLLSIMETQLGDVLRALGGLHS